MKYMVSAYYHGSEAAYAFGPFDGTAGVVEFIESDPTPNKHEKWDITAINTPDDYGTGNEYSVEHFEFTDADVYTESNS